MAKKAAAEKRSRSLPRGGGTANTVRLVIFLTVLLILAYFALPSLLILVAAMLPTVVALIAERGKHRYAWICVGGTTFAATCPYLLYLWRNGQTIGVALDILSSIPAWLVMYCGAAFGWGLYMAMPPIIGVFIEFLIKRRISGQRARQNQLIEQWGKGVSEVEGPAD